MPFVNVKVIEGVVSPAQKKELLGKVTDAVVAVCGDNLRDIIWVTIEEVKSGDWAIGGKPITTADVEAIAKGTPGKP